MKTAQMRELIREGGRELGVKCPAGDFERGRGSFSSVADRCGAEKHNQWEHKGPIFVR